VVSLNDAIEDPVKCVENLVRGILAGNIFDLGSAQVPRAFSWTYFKMTVLKFSDVLVEPRVVASELNSEE